MFSVTDEFPAAKDSLTKSVSSHSSYEFILLDGVNEFEKLEVT